MIVNSLGEFVDSKGSSRGISNELDRKLIGYLRKQSDVVVTGGNTARSENYRVPSHCALAVISRTFNLDDERFFHLGNPETALQELRNLGFKRILLETGPTLSKYFLARDQVDEFCLTVAGASQPVANKVLKSFGAKLALVESVEIDGMLFTRWRRGNR